MLETMLKNKGCRFILPGVVLSRDWINDRVGGECPDYIVLILGATLDRMFKICWSAMEDARKNMYE